MLCFVFAALVVLLDQFIKRWILLTLALHESSELVPGVIGLTHVRNTGAAFSILSDQRWLLIGIACVAAILLIAILLRYNDGFWGTLGLAAVLGGTIGNLADRISYGHVVDMFELYFVEFAIFNVADIFITLGGITFLIYFIATSVKPEKSEEGVFEESPAEYSPDEYRREEDQIGLYDFQYGEESYDNDQAEYEDASDAQPVSGSYAEPTSELSDDYSDPGSSGYYNDPPADVTSALDALSELELELKDADRLEDYDVDDLLREYGFEDDTDQM